MNYIYLIYDIFFFSFNLNNLLYQQKLLYLQTYQLVDVLVDQLVPIECAKFGVFNRLA